MDVGFELDQKIEELSMRARLLCERCYIVFDGDGVALLCGDNKLFEYLEKNALKTAKRIARSYRLGPYKHMTAGCIMIENLELWIVDDYVSYWEVVDKVYDSLLRILKEKLIETFKRTATTLARTGGNAYVVLSNHGQALTCNNYMSGDISLTTDETLQIRCDRLRLLSVYSSKYLGEYNEDRELVKILIPHDPNHASQLAKKYKLDQIKLC